MFLSILAAVDGSASSGAAFEHAVDLARALNAKLTIVTVTPPPSHFVPLAGVDPDTMERELEVWADRIQREALATVPDDVIVHRVQRSGHAGPEIVAEIERGNYDLVVVGSRGRGRAQEGLLGSVNAHLHFHARVPLLSVPPPE